MIPFLYGLAITNGSIGKHASKLLKERASNRWPILSLMVIRILIAIGFILAAITSYFKLGGWGVLAVIGAGLLLIIVGKASFRNLSGLERRFMENFNAREEMERRKAPVTSSLRDNLSGYDIKTSAVVVPQDFAYIGKTLREMPFRKKSGVNIVKIKRGSKSIQIPSGDEPIYPGDILLAVGTSEQLHSFEQIIKENTLATKEDAPEFAVKLATLLPESFLTGKKIRETDMRGSGCMIISIKHDGKIIANPGADYVFCEGDTIWIAGEEKSCDWFLGTN